MRIVASFFVVLVHVLLPAPAGLYAKTIGRFAVPFFLMVTGWYIRKDDDEKTAEAAKHSLFSILRLTVAALAVSAAGNTVQCLISGDPPFSWLDSGVDLQDFLLYNYTTVFSPVMWYLFGLIYALVIYLILAKLKVIRLACWLCFPLIVINLIRSSADMSPWFHQGNWMFMSVPFLFLGSLLKDRRWCERIPAVLCWAMIAAGIIASVFETPTGMTALFSDKILYIGTLPLVFGIFTLCVRGKDVQWPRALAFFGRTCTTGIFIIHCSVYGIIQALVEIPDGFIAWLMPLIVYLLSGALVLAFVQQKRKLQRA